jgi:hypothetical protein
MKFLSRILSVFFSLALLVALVVGGYFVLTFLVARLWSIDFQVAAVTASASGVALLAALIIASSIRQARKETKANRLCAEKAATYQSCIDLWADLLRHGHGAGNHSPNALSEELLTLERRLMLYGSSGVVKAHTALRALERDSGAHNPHMRMHVAKMLMEMRQDLGVKTRGLTVEELLPLLLAEADRTSVPGSTSPYENLTPRVSLASSS